MKGLDEEGKVNETVLKKVLSPEEHGLSVSLKGLLDYRTCFEPCREELGNILFQCEPL